MRTIGDARSKCGRLADAVFGQLVTCQPSWRGTNIGVWRSLVARFVRDEEVAGSNPVTPTILVLYALAKEGFRKSVEP